MRPILTTLAAAALGLAAIIPASAQVEFRAPGMSVDVGNAGPRDRYYDGDEYDRDEAPPAAGRSYYYDNDNNCRVEIVRERHWDGSVYVHRERHCD